MIEKGYNKNYVEGKSAACPGESKTGEIVGVGDIHTVGYAICSIFNHVAGIIHYIAYSIAYVLDGIACVITTPEPATVLLPPVVPLLVPLMPAVSSVPFMVPVSFVSVPFVWVSFVVSLRQDQPCLFRYGLSLRQQ
ncbi:MAG: hypothetical protein ACLVLH_18455 [Eisenbergiella massiliensis]